jgi:hypothetical protein
MAVAAVFTIAVAVSTPRVPRLFLILGIALLGLDSKAPFAYDQLMNLVGQPSLHRGDLLYELGVTLDEALETMGWILVAIGLWDAAYATHPTASVQSSGKETPAADNATYAAQS